MLGNLALVSLTSINSGAPGDKFEGFELKYRVCEPVSGSGVAIAEASDIGKSGLTLGLGSNAMELNSM